ncbi:MAG: exosortase system-associated protein, TIGR04073 family [Candidatus Omnitrophica bacterium]|nr:exosortase system-associated protein, TIGR04073 family [Candidatus Omnitrophota bacterium]
MKKAVVTGLLLFIALTVMANGLVFAKTLDGPSQKLERGAKNLVWGWTELPKSIVNTTKETNILKGILFGTLKGVANAFGRTTSGLVDTVTFPAGTYDQPAIDPTIIQD